MYPIIKSMLDEMCEIAKQEMKDKKEHELGSWKRAVTVADGTWQTRGWHSKNATFTIRNYLNGALLYYHHLCQKGSDNVIEEELYKGTSKSAEGYAARLTFRRAKEEGIQVAVHWQDADSSSAKAVSDVFLDAEIMICGGHAGRAHKKILELRHKMKKVSKTMIEKYKDTFPALGKLRCKCEGGNHSPTCGCLNLPLISKAHTNFSSILMEAQSQEEFVKRLEALPKHARDIHEWEGGRCDFHPLRVCSCKKCSDKEQIECEGKPYKTRMKLDCEFHALLYEIECIERAAQASKLVHPILKRGHSNAVEASHNVLIRFRSKDIYLERLHYHVSTNIGLLQANMTYMNAKFGTSYHWLPELYQRMKLPVFEGVVEALERYNERRKRRLEEAKCTPQKKRRIQLKKKRTTEAMERIKWSKKHGHDTYFGGSDVEMAGDSDDGVNQKKGKGRSRGTGNPQGKGKCSACGSSTHRRFSHRDCPFHQGRTKKDALSVSPSVRSTPAASESGNESIDDSSDSCMSDEVLIDICTCGAEGRAHKRSCPLSFRNRKPGRTLFPASAPAAPSVPSSPERHTPAPSEDVKPEIEDVENVKPETEVERPTVEVGDYVCIHGGNMGDFHVPCRMLAAISSTA